MNELEQTQIYASVHGKRWNFPSHFVPETSESRIAAEEKAIQDSLKALLANLSVERFIKPKDGLDMHNIIFMPMGSVTKALLKDHIRYSILFNESRISLLSLELDTTSEQEGKLSINLEYLVRSTNSSNNLVFPFYRTDRSNVSTTAELSNSW
jgi:hypothetical protein